MITICGKQYLGASLLWVAVALGGCGHAPETASNAAPPGPAGMPSGPGASTGADGSKRKIAAILMQDDQFFRLNEIGMKDAAAKEGVDLLSSSDNGALDKEITLVDTYADQGVAAIMVSPLNPKGSVPALQRAAAKGIKIVTYNNPLNEPFVSCLLQSDDVQLGSSTGKVTADYIRTKLGGTAKIACLEYVSHLADVGKLRPQGFRAEIAKLPGAQIVAEQDAWTAADAERVATDILNAHPEINVIWCANEGATVGATTAVKNAGKAGKVAVFGTDMSDQIASFLLSPDNILQAVTGQRAYEMGSRMVATTVQILDGKPVQKVQVLPGQIFTRDKPDEVKAFQDQVRKLS